MSEQTQNVTSGKRRRISTVHGNAYLFVAPDDIMVTVAAENDPRNAETRALSESVCRIASKAMKAGLPMEDIVEQLRKADHGRSSILGAIADGMEDYICGRM
jgi:hypothetical protein